jgi:glyoxylase-like metal-dependent hydrolase (beta-lactamase superfamily II)
MKKHTLLAGLVVALVLVVAARWSATLPALSPHAFTPLPAATTPLELCWIDTGTVDAPARYGAAGVVKADAWHVTSPALLVRHPKGDLLIDAGLSPTMRADVTELGPWRRFVTSQTAERQQPTRLLTDALRMLGVTKVMAVVISHAHLDHLGGLTVLPDVPLWLSAEEKAFIESGNGAVLPAHARAVQGRMVPLVFEPVPFADADVRADLFGDGSVVVTPAFGHTPGSVLIFINAPGGRLVHVGDIINLAESVEREVPKSLAMRLLTDEDRSATSAQVARLVALARADPKLIILPAHDRPAWAAVFGADDLTRPPPCVRW